MRTGPSEAEMTILGGVPLDTQHNFSNENGRTQNESNSQKIGKPKTMHRRDKSTAENLWTLTEDLAKMQGKVVKQDLFGEGTSLGDMKSSSADVFVSNTNQIMRRRRAQHYLAKHAQATGPQTATSRWKKLRATVEVSGAADIMAEADRKQNQTQQETEIPNVNTVLTDSKTNDTNTLKDEEIGHVEIDENNNTASCRASQRHAPARNVAVELNQGFQDFEEWVKFKKSAMYTYGLLLLFVIIPATGIAAL
jgi:hypothetical protein